MKFFSILTIFLVFLSHSNAQVSINVVPEVDSTSISENLELEQGDIFNILSDENLIEVDPTARYSRSYGVYLRGASSSSHKVYLDGHDMEDMTGLGRNSRMDLSISSPLERAEVLLGPQGVENGAGAQSGVIKINSTDKNFYSFRLNNFLGNSLVINQNNKKLKVRVATAFENAPSVFPGGVERDPIRNLDLRSSIKSSFGVSSVLFLDKKQDYDDVNADNISNESNFRKLSIFHDYKKFSSDFTKEYQLKLGTQLVDREENFNGTPQKYQGQTYLLDGSIKSKELNNFIKFKFENITAMENLDVSPGKSFFLDVGARKNFEESLVSSLGVSVSTQRFDRFIIMGDVVKRLKNTTIKLSTGGRYPSFYELHSSFGNKNLRSQKTIGADLFYDYKKFRFSAFAQRYSDFINYDLVNNQYENIDKLTSYGIEGKVNLDQYLSAGLSYKIIKSERSKRMLPGRNTATTTLKYNPFGQMNIRYRGVYGRVGVSEEKLEALHYTSLENRFFLGAGFLNISVQNLFNEKSDSLFPTQNGGVVTQVEFTRLL